MSTFRLGPLLSGPQHASARENGDTAPMPYAAAHNGVPGATPKKWTCLPRLCLRQSAPPDARSSFQSCVDH